MVPSDEHLPRLPKRGWLWLIMGVFVAAMLVVYGKSLHDGFVRWDDGLLIYENPGVMEMSPASLTRIFTTYDPELYIPITLLSYQVDYALGGPNPFFFHLENWFWHLCNGLLVGWLAYLLIRRKWIAVFVGLLFLLHPLHTEAVAWASARKDVLSLFFLLLSMIGYLYFRDTGHRRTYHLSIAAFCIGLMCKGQILTLPVILILIDLFRGRRFSLEMLKDKLPYFALTIVFGIIGLFGKTGVVASSSMLAKILMSFKSSMHYLYQLFVPLHFSLLYPYTKAVTLLSPDFYLPVLGFVVLAMLALVLRKKVPELWFGLLFYWMTLSPTFLNFAKGTDLDVYYASDRYAYLSSIGIFLLLGFLLARIARASEQREKLMAGIASLLVVVPLGFIAHRQSLVWKDTESLFANVITYFPQSSYVAHNNLGNMYRLRGELDRSITEYKAALAIRQHPKTYANLGGAYRQLKQYDAAQDAYTKGLALDPSSKDAHFGLGILDAELGKIEDAKAEYRKAIALDPTYEEAYTNLGSVLLSQGDTDGAIVQYKDALSINKYFADAQYNLAVAYSAKGLLDDAIIAYQRAAELAPNQTAALINLGILEAKKGDRAASVAAFQQVLKIDPTNKTATEALRQLGGN